MVKKNKDKIISVRVTDETYYNVTDCCDRNGCTKEDILKYGVMAKDHTLETPQYLLNQRNYHLKKALHNLHSAILEFNTVENYNKQLHEKDNEFNINKDVIILHDQHGNKISYKPQYILK